MRRQRNSVLALLAALCLSGAAGAYAQGYADEDRDWGVAPVQRLRQAPYHAPTPREIPGGRVIGTLELKALREGAAERDAPLVIDVAGGDGHASLPGARWIAGAGRGAHYLDPLQAFFSERLTALTGGDKARALVFLCVNSQCWLSYNAALRAVALGYTSVYWYRGGIEAWQEAGLPLTRLQRREAGEDKR